MKVGCLIFISAALVQCGAEEVDDECQRFSPEDVQETFFSAIFRQRIELILDALTELFDGVEDMKNKLPVFGDKFSKESADEGSEAEDPMDLVREEISMAVRVHQRQWNRIKDTHLDIMEPSRCPKAPRTLTDLKEVISELPGAYRTSAEHLEEAISAALADVATVFKPLVLVLYNILMLGGEAAEKNAGKTGNNFQGKILFKLVNIKAGKQKATKAALFNDLITLAEALESDFEASGRKSSQSVFWKFAGHRMAETGLNKLEAVTEEHKIDLLSNFFYTMMGLEEETIKDVNEMIKEFQDLKLK